MKDIWDRSFAFRTPIQVWENLEKYAKILTAQITKPAIFVVGKIHACLHSARTHKIETAHPLSLSKYTNVVWKTVIVSWKIQ